MIIITIIGWRREAGTQKQPRGHGQTDSPWGLGGLRCVQPIAARRQGCRCLRSLTSHRSQGHLSASHDRSQCYVSFGDRQLTAIGSSPSPCPMLRSFLWFISASSPFSESVRFLCCFIDFTAIWICVSLIYPWGKKKKTCSFMKFKIALFMKNRLIFVRLLLIRNALVNLPLFWTAYTLCIFLMPNVLNCSNA